jgi:hypothetical protein
LAKRRSIPRVALGVESFTRRFAVTALLAVVIPLIAGYVGNLKPLEQIFLGIFVFMLGMLVQLSRDVGKLRSVTLQHALLWTAQNEADRLLGNVRADYSQILLRHDAFFVRYFDLRLRRLSEEIFKARASGDLQVEQDFDTTDMMLRDFAGDAQHIIRAVHFLSDNEFLFGVHASHFFCDVANLVALGRVQEVRRLLVVTEEVELQDERTRRLIAFHHGTSGFDYRIIRKRDFDRINRDFNIPTDTHDFGVYAGWYAYRSVVAADNEVKGRFSADAEAVRKFTGAFDRSWASDLARKTSGQPAAPPTLSELFDRDGVSPNRPGIPRVTYEQVAGRPVSVEISGPPRATLSSGSEHV